RAMSASALGCWMSASASERATIAMSAAMPHSCALSALGAAVAMPARPARRRAGMSRFMWGLLSPTLASIMPKVRTSGLELRPELAPLVLRAVHVHVEIARLVRLHLRFRELRARRHAVGVAVLDERDDHRAVLPLGRLVDVRGGALDSLRGDAPAHVAIGVHADGAGAGGGGGHGRDFLGAGEAEL